MTITSLWPVLRQLVHPCMGVGRSCYFSFDCVFLSVRGSEIAHPTRELVNTCASGVGQSLVLGLLEGSLTRVATLS